jgi:hypothetical protein
MVGRQALLASANEDTLKKWRVVGADDYHGRRVLDLLEYQSDVGPLRVAIDPVTHYAVRMFWQSADPPTIKNPTYEIELDNYVLHKTFRLPQQILIFTGGTLTAVDTPVYSWEQP